MDLKIEDLVKCPDGCSNVDDKCHDCVEGSNFEDVLKLEKESLLRALLVASIDGTKKEILKFVAVSDSPCKLIDIGESLGLSAPLVAYHVNGSSSSPGLGLFKLGLVSKVRDGRGDSLVGIELTLLGREVLDILDKKEE